MTFLEPQVHNENEQEYEYYKEKYEINIQQ